MKPIICVPLLLIGIAANGAGGASEALTGFDGRSNGLISQDDFEAARTRFEEAESVSEGLGPMFNGQSCATCHAGPITGATSQITELRAGHMDLFRRFIPAAGGSLIRERAISPALQIHVPDVETVRSFRITLSVLGLGYVEAIDDATFFELANRQLVQTRGRVAGQVVEVPVLEAAGIRRVGRFGWKNQHASLLSFAADAYSNEMGITNRLLPFENSALGTDVSQYDAVPDPEDGANTPGGEQGIDALALFMRSTKAPGPDPTLAATADAQVGRQLFRAVGCALCHVETLLTAPPGTSINGGTFVVPDALGNKAIHPFSDFLLHDIGTGDGAAQGDATGAQFRTPPLWGLRTRTRLIHDGNSLTVPEAIRRHRGEAIDMIGAFRRLTERERAQLVVFLRSL